MQGGIHLYELHQWLHPRGWAMPVLGSVSGQSIAGALATVRFVSIVLPFCVVCCVIREQGTHGSGITKNILAAGCIALDILTADGTTISASATQNHGVFKVNLHLRNFYFLCAHRGM